MKPNLFIALFCGIFAIAAGVARAQTQPHHDVLSEIMIPPQLILQHADDLGLDPGQREFVQSQLEQVQAKFPELQQDLQQEMAALRDLLGQEHPDEQKALAQLDKVLDREREIKRAQLSLALTIRSKLTAEQLGHLRDLGPQLRAEAHNQGPNQPPPDSLRDKMKQVQELARKSHEDGKDLSEVRPLMEQIQPLMRDGKFKEAEEILDRALKVLQEPDQDQKK